MFNDYLTGSHLESRGIVEYVIYSVQVLSYVNGLHVPVMISLLLLIRPCQPPFLASFLLPSCTLGSLEPIETCWPLKLLILLVEYVIFGQTVISGSFYLNYVIIAGICCISKYTCTFSFNPGHKNDGFSEYRALQVASCHVNDCLRYVLFPACIVGPPLLQMLGTFACIKLRDQIDWPLFGLFPLIVGLSLILTLMPLIAAAKIYVESVEIIKRFDGWSAAHAKESKVWRRMVKSIRPARIYFGGNFVDGCTPLVVQDFCVHQTASLLVYTKSVRIGWNVKIEAWVFSLFIEFCNFPDVITSYKNVWFHWQKRCSNFANNCSV